SFPGQQVNTTSAAQVVTLTNSGSGTLSSISISITGADSNQFAKTTTCGTSLNAGASCTISLTFKPTSTGDKSSAVTIADNASDSPQSVSLTGRGLNNTVSLTPSPLSFGSQPLNTGATLAVTHTNAATSTDPATVSGVRITGTNSGDFAPTNNCTAAVPVGQTCSISVAFTPTATGTKSGVVAVADNAPGSPQTVPLSGTATAPAVSLSPSALTFAGQAVGTTSSQQTVKLSNTGNATLTINSIALTGANAGDFTK